MPAEVFDGVTGRGEPLSQRLQRRRGVEHLLSDHLVAVGGSTLVCPAGVNAQRDTPVGAHCIAVGDAQGLNDRQGRRQGAAGGDHHRVTISDHGPAGLLDRLRHVAVVVDGGAVHVKTDHLLARLVHEAAAVSGRRNRNG